MSRAARCVIVSVDGYPVRARVSGKWNAENEAALVKAVREMRARVFAKKRIAHPDYTVDGRREPDELGEAGA